MFVWYRYLVLRLIAHQQKFSVSSYPRLCCVSSQFLLGRKDHVSCNFLIFQFMQKKLILDISMFWLLVSMRKTDTIHCFHYRCQSSYVAFWWSKRALASFLRIDGVTRFSATTHYMLLCLSSNHFGMYGIVQLGYGYHPAVYIHNQTMSFIFET